MGKNKPSTVINNIDQLKLEIDYDKLAEAIVRAQDKVAMQSEIIPNSNISTKGKFWKNVWKIIWNKKSTNGIMISESMALLTSIVYRIMAALLLLISGAMTINFTDQVDVIDWNLISIVKVFLGVMAIVLMFLFCIILIGAANDIEREKDKNYIVSVFSGVVSFAALIVALIALKQ